MRSLAYVGLGVLCIVLALGTFLVIADPAELIRDQLITRVKAQTGRDLTIAGGTRFTVFPSIGISMSDVSLSPPPGMKGKPTVKMAQLTTSLKLLPLLQRQIIVERLILTKPIVNLHVDFKGRKSWDFAATQRPIFAPVRYAQARPKGQLNDAAPNSALPPALRDFVNGSTAAAAARSPLAMLAGLSLEDVRIDNGTLHYWDDRSGARQTLKAVNLKVSLADIISPLHTKGDLVWTGEKIKFNAKLKSLKALLSERPTKLSTQISMRHVNAQYTGGITMGAVLDLDGQLKAKSRSVRDLARWLGVKLPASAGFGALDLGGVLTMRGNQIELFRAKLHFDGATANGDVSLITGARRPKIRARLNLSVLDLNKYIPYDGAANTANTSGADGTGGTGGGTRKIGVSKPANKGATNINDLLERAARQGTQVRGFTKRAATGWSSAPIDASGLTKLDADLTFNVGKILFKQIKIGDTRLKAKLVKGKLVADLRDMQLYNGEGNATVTVRPKRGGVSLSANIRLNHISALPLLRDAAQFERIDGRGTLNLLVSSEGQSQKSIVAALLGNGRFTFSDGALVGVNIPKLIRGLQSGQIGDLNGGKAERTDFSELSGTFQITKGVAKNTDMRLRSPFLRMSGAGVVSLLPRTLNYTVKPKIVASLAGQGNNSPLAGLEIPVRIVGSWDKLKVKADFAALTANPQKTLKAIEKIGRSLRGKKGKKLLDDLLGGGKGGKSKAKDLLNQLFR